MAMGACCHAIMSRAEAYQALIVDTPTVARTATALRTKPSVAERAAKFTWGAMVAAPTAAPELADRGERTAFSSKCLMSR